MVSDVAEEAEIFIIDLEAECLEKALAILRNKAKQSPRQRANVSAISARSSMSDRSSLLTESRIRVRMSKDFVRVLNKNINESYKFLQKLGEGSFGSVYKGICLRSKQ